MSRTLAESPHDQDELKPAAHDRRREDAIRHAIEQRMRETIEWWRTLPPNLLTLRVEDCFTDVARLLEHLDAQKRLRENRSRRKR